VIQWVPVLLPALLVAGEAPDVIRVGDVGFTRASVAARARDLRAAGVTFQPDQLVESMTDEAALAAEARRTGFDKHPDVRALVDLETATLLAEHVTETEISPSVKPTEEALRLLFHQSADTVDLELVVVGTEPEAAAVRARLAAGGEFALEAARSVDPRSSRNKGRTGPLSRIQMDPLLAEPAFAQPVGALFGPVKMTNGWGVARVVTRVVGDEAAYRARRASLVPMAQKAAVARAREHYVSGLRKKAGAKVDEAYLRTLEKAIEVPEAEVDRAIGAIGGTPIRYREILPSLRRFASGRANSHMLGGSLKVKFAWSLVDDRLLAADARARGIDKAPAVAAALARAESRAQATALAARIAGELPASATPAERGEAVKRRIAAIRKQLGVQVDKAAARAAASEGGEGSAGHR
jgi:parvulin-like peptidyl-prolyl isomerase